MAGMMSRMMVHLGTGTGAVHRRFNAEAMARIRDAVVAAERGHAGEIRFAVEATLPLRTLWHRRDARSRALDVFSQLRVWDTEQNTGVLLYLLWADRAIEVVADRGIARLVPASDWQSICDHVRDGLRSTHPADAVISAIGKIGDLLRSVLPVEESTADEMPDEPVVL